MANQVVKVSRVSLGIGIALLCLAPFMGAQTFSAPINISNYPPASHSPMAVDRFGTIYALWKHYLPQGEHGIINNLFVSRSTDGGQTFSAPVEIPGSGTVMIKYHQIAVDGSGNVFVSWTEDIWGRNYNIDRLCFSRSTDGGQTFSAFPLVLSVDIRFNCPFEMEIDPAGIIHFIWQEYRGVSGVTPINTIFYCRSTDAGVTFSSLVPISRFGVSPWAYQMAIAEDGRIAIVWSEYHDGLNLWSSISSDGVSFSPPANVNEFVYSSDIDRLPRENVAFDSAGNLYVAWTQYRAAGRPNDLMDVYFARSADGIHFDAPVLISDGASRSEYANLALDSQDHINLIWTESPFINGAFYSEVKFRRSTDGGQTFSLPINLTAETGTGGWGTAGVMVVDAVGNIDVVLGDYPKTGGYPRLWFSRSTDGINFSTPVAFSNDPPLYPAGIPRIALGKQGQLYLSYTFPATITPGFPPPDIWFVSVVFNQPPVAEAGGPYTVEEGATLSLDASGSTDPDSAIVSYEWDLDGDGLYDDATGATVSFSRPDDAVVSVGLKVTDEMGATTTDTAVVTVVNAPPKIVSLTAPIDPIPVNAAISVSAAFTDAGKLDTHTAVWAWSGGPSAPGTVTETEGSGSVTGSHAYATPGIYTVTLTITDDDGGIATLASTLLVVYNPTGEFVTGAGWFISPPGAFAANPSLTGKAHFGIMSKYQTGATVPTGQTKFQFQIADLNFHSESYDWMVVAGAKVQYKGVGTINGQGSYRFMITAIDGQIPGGGGLDKFRIRIWNAAGGGLIYDNEVGKDENGDPTTVIAGGSIVIHK